jgi:hypothetical protein
VFLGFADADPLVTDTDPDPAPNPSLSQKGVQRVEIKLAKLNFNTKF